MAMAAVDNYLQSPALPLKPLRIFDRQFDDVYFQYKNNTNKPCRAYKYL